MQKLMIFIEKSPALGLRQFHQALVDCLSGIEEQYSAIRYALADEDVAPAQHLVISASRHPKDAVISLYGDGKMEQQALLACLRPFSLSARCYRVDERVPLQHDAPVGRVEGMCQVALLKRPADLPREQWLDIWLNSHTEVAIGTQSTFSYRQNIVTSTLPDDAVDAGNMPLYDAIVEEQFPPAAMTDRSVFFNAPGNKAGYRANEKAMVESVMRFIDFSAFECVPMSEYRLK